jgi:hypothetical protein
MNDTLNFKFSTRHDSTPQCCLLVFRVLSNSQTRSGWDEESSSSQWWQTHGHTSSRWQTTAQRCPHPLLHCISLVKVIDKHSYCIVVEEGRRGLLSYSFYHIITTTLQKSLILCHYISVSPGPGIQSRGDMAFKSTRHHFPLMHHHHHHNSIHHYNNNTCHHHHYHKTLILYITIKIIILFRLLPLPLLDSNSKEQEGRIMADEI